MLTTSYDKLLGQKGKASADSVEANSKRYLRLLIFLFDFEMVFLNAWKSLYNEMSEAIVKL